MNKRQKLVQQHFLNNEEAVIKRLNQVYGKSLTDINDKIKNLTFTIDKLQQKYDWMDPDDPERAKVKSQIQSKIYQKKYQEQLQTQVDGILKQMQSKSYLTVSDYLDECYEDGFIGTIFDAHGQGIPIVTPINQESMVRAVQLESKISKGLYTRLGEDVDLLKKKITAQVSRSISTGMTFAQTAKQLEGYTRIGYNNAVRIARTEGHRIQTTATMDAMHVAKDKGADVVKQWDSTLDGRTRHSHAVVDGEIRELNKPFSNGLDFPGDPDGKAAEVVNCRCALLQRAKWALDDDELQTLQDRAKYFGLDKSTEFDDFKKKYLKAVETPEVIEVTDDVVNKYGQTIVFDERMDSEKWSESKTIIKNLANEYDTRLTKVEVGANRAGGDVDMGGTLRLSSSANDVAIHEFAHSIATEALTKYGVADDSEFWKEIKSVRRAYRKDVGDNSSRWISSYEHSNKAIDEFFAEAFTQAKMNQMGLPLPSKYGNDLTYSNQVLKITDKYFKKAKVEKVTYSQDAFPEAFRKNKQGKGATQIFADTLSDADNLNPNIAKLYTHIDDLPDLPAPYKISYTAKDHALSTTYDWVGRVQDYQLKIPKMVGDNLMGEKETAFHEIAHFIDKKFTGNDTMHSQKFKKLTDAMLSSGDSMSAEIKSLFDDFKTQYTNMRNDIGDKFSTYRKTLSEDARNGKIPYKEYNKLWNASYREQEAEMDYLARNLCGSGVTGLSDIYDALSGGTYRDNQTLLYGHGSKYYSNASKRNSETFANYMSLSVNRPDLVEMLRKDKPELCKALDELIEEMAGTIK